MILSAHLFYYGFAAVALTVLTGVIPLLKRWHEDHLHAFVSFSAGVLMATAFLHLLPDAVEGTTPHTLGLCIMSSFLFLFILEKFIMIHPCEETHCDYHTMGLTAYIGMLLHTFFDGIALGSAFFSEDKGLAFMVFFAIMAHKIPSAFALSSILKKARWTTAKILIFIFCFGLTIPAGALASMTVLQSVGGQFVGMALAISLGTFLYISTSDFLPEVHRSHERRFINLGSFMIGIVLMTVFSFFD